MQISSLAPFLFVALTPMLAAQGGKPKVDFVKQVLPILKANCFECHGPKEQEADLRFDKKAGLFVKDKADWVVLPGNHKESELYVRITLPKDDEDIMPSEGAPLKKKEIEILRKWITEGASWPAGADATIAKMLDAGTPKILKFEFDKKLSPADEAAEKAAMKAVSKAGGLAMRIAASSIGSEVNLSLLGKKADNAKLDLAKDLSKSLVRLNLARTEVTDAGLATVKSFGELRWLNLSNTKVTDAGLDNLAGLSKLTYLNLYGTQVTDAGIAKLSGLTNLRKLFLWQTKATKSGAAKLTKTVKGLKIDMGDYAAILRDIKPPAKTPQKKGKKKAVAINTKCPITGRKVNASKTAVFEGQVIGLCCAKCKKKFDKNPAKFIGKVKEFKAAKGTVAVNKKCPVTNKSVKAGAISSFRGEVIGFCCNKCKAKFDKNPAKYVSKLAVFSAPVPANKKCPVSGKAVVATSTSSYQGKLIGFCCNKCKAKFDKKPAKFLSKLKGVFEK